MKKQNIIFPICLILIITFISYYPSLKNGFVTWDDPAYVTGNLQIRSLSLQNVKNIFTSFTMDLYTPLSNLSYAIEYNIFKLNPKIYHITNLFIHLLNCILVFWLFFLISDKISVSFLVSLLFGIHPLHVESVAWISERKDVLYAFFFLLSLISYIYYYNKKEAKYYYFALILFILSILSKPMAVTLPVILFIFDYLLNRKFTWDIFKEKILFFIIAVIFSIINLYGGTPPKLHYDIFEKIFFPTYVLLFHLFKTIIPLKLSAIYPHPEKIGNFLPSIFYISFIVIVLLATAVYFSKRYTKKIIFGSLFFFIASLPVIQLVSISYSITFDRYSYLPSLGLFYIFAEVLNWLYFVKFPYLKIAKILISIFYVFIVGLFSYLTWNRCYVWNNSIALWDDVIKKYPNFKEAYNNRAYAYHSTGNDGQAIIDFSRAIEINPDYFKAYNNRGNIYKSIGKYDKALSDFNEAIKINPGFTQVYYNRAIVYCIKKEYNKAAEDIKKLQELGFAVPAEFQKILQQFGKK